MEYDQFLKFNRNARNPVFGVSHEEKMTIVSKIVPNVTHDVNANVHLQAMTVTSIFPFRSILLQK